MGDKRRREGKYLGINDLVSFDVDLPDLSTQTLINIYLRVSGADKSQINFDCT